MKEPRGIHSHAGLRYDHHRSGACLVSAKGDEMRKKVGIDNYLMSSLAVLAQDFGCSVESLADDAVRELLRKHYRPRTLEEAFRQSLRTLPMNDNGGDPQAKRSR